MIKPTEDKIQDYIGNFQTEKQKASESYSENPLSKYKEKEMALNKVPSLDKYGSSSKTETENTVKLDTKKYLYHKPVQMIKYGRTRTNRNNNQYK